MRIYYGNIYDVKLALWPKRKGALSMGKKASTITLTLIRETHYPNLWRIPHKDWG